VSRIVALGLPLFLVLLAVSFPGQSDRADAQIGCTDSAPIQWTTASGGNGHFYQRICSNPTSWANARAAADADDKYLVTITSEEEQTFIHQNFTNATSGGDCCNYWAGGFQPNQAPGQTNPAVGWQWVTGEPFVAFANVSSPPPGLWNSPGEPNDCYSPCDVENNEENVMEIGYYAEANDQNDVFDDPPSNPYILEWEIVSASDEEREDPTNTPTPTPTRTPTRTPTPTPTLDPANLGGLAFPLTRRDATPVPPVSAPAAGAPSQPAAAGQIVRPPSTGDGGLRDTQ
jgi:hypothetical protein